MMRAIGKGSLASLLAVGFTLRGLYYGSLFSELTIAMLTVPFIPAILDAVSELRQHQCRSLDGDRC